MRPPTTSSQSRPALLNKIIFINFLDLEHLAGAHADLVADHQVGEFAAID